jgi:zinc protease
MPMRSFVRLNIALSLTLALCLWGCTEPIVVERDVPSPPAPARIPTVIDKARPIGASGRLAFVQAAAEALEVVERTVADGTTVARLSNGLTVIVKPMRTAPVVSVQAYVRAGGLYEREYLGCGLSHLLEHLVAKDASHDAGPSADKKVKQVTDRVSQIGGQANAHTGLDDTCYYISAAAGKTDECINLIAEWMARPSITPEDFRREHGVVQREQEKGKDEPAAQAWHAHARNVFGTHPAGVPVIGYAEPLAKVTLSDVMAYHRQMYVPQNMVFCVVGDVEADKVLARACTAFAGLEQGRIPDLSLPEVQPLSGVRRVSQAYKDLKEADERISFLTIPLLHEDLYSLDMLAYVLGAGESSRFPTELYRKQKLVTSVSCDSWTPAWGKGTFTIHFRSAPEKADAAERAILAELEKVIAEGVTAEELTRAKRQKLADHVYSQQTAESVGSTLAGDFLSAGDVLFSKHYTGRIQAVTARQVQAAAKKYITPDRVAVTRLVPRLDAAPPGGAKTARKFEKQVFKLETGLTVILQPADAGLVSMAYVVKGGLLEETQETNGLGALMMSLSTRGTKNYTAGQIDEFFDRAGGGISGACGNNSFYWQATVLEDSFDKALEIFADVIACPTFPEKELEILRPKLLAQIRAQDEDWFGQLNKFFREKFFTNSPYGMLAIGREEVVGKATPEQVKVHYLRNILPDNGPPVLAIYGDFDPEKTRKKVAALFNRLAGQARRPEPLPGARKVKPGGETHVLKTDKQQAGIIVAVPGMKITDIKDRVAIDVLDTIISGYQLPAGWLHTELRGKELVYVVHAVNWPGLAPGAFFAYAACQPEKAKEVVEIVERNLRTAAEYKPTQEEINQAVNTILTANLLDRQELSELAMDAAINEAYGLGHDFNRKQEKLYRQVTPEEVLRVARKYLAGGYFVNVTTPRPELLEQRSEKKNEE